MKVLRKLAYWPISLKFRSDLRTAKSLLNGPLRYRAYEALGIYGFGENLVRVDFPPNPPVRSDLGMGAETISDIFEKYASVIQVHVDAAIGHMQAYLRIPVEYPGHGKTGSPWLRNEFIFEADLISLLGMLHHYRPKKYIEIGSGMSTRVARHATQSGLSHSIIALDPHPRLDVAEIADKVIMQPLTIDSAGNLLRIIESGDILFFDGSHRSFPGSDVNAFFFELLPQLPSGCIVHIHDIYLPYEYPKNLLPRLWSEQYLLAAYLIGDKGKTLRPLLPVWYTLNTEPFSSQ